MLNSDLNDSGHGFYHMIGAVLAFRVIFFPENMNGFFQGFFINLIGNDVSVALRGGFYFITV